MESYSIQKKEEILHLFVDNQKNVQATSELCDVHYQTIRKWIKTDWGRSLILKYELEKNTGLLDSKALELLEAKVDFVKSEFKFHDQTDRLLELIQQRAIELIPDATKLRDLAAIYNAVAGVKLAVMRLGLVNPEDKNQGESDVIQYVRNQLIVMGSELPENLWPSDGKKKKSFDDDTATG